MAKRLNKKLVVGMTIVGMFLTILAAVLVVARFLPKQDPKPAVANAIKAAQLGTQDGYKEAAKQYNLAANRAKALADSGGEAKYEEDSKEYRLKAGDMALKAGDPATAIDLWNKVILLDPKHEKAYERILDVFLDFGANYGRIADTAADLCNKANKDNPIGLHAWGLALVNQHLARKENLAEGEDKLQQAFALEKTNSAYADSLARHYLTVAASRDLQKTYRESLAAWKKAASSRPADTPSEQAVTAEDLLTKADAVYADLMEALNSADDAARVQAWKRHQFAWVRTHGDFSDEDEQQRKEKEAAAMSAWWTATVSDAWRRRGTYQLAKIEARIAPWRGAEPQPSREELDQLTKVTQADEAEALRSYTEALKVAKDLKSNDETVVENLVSLARFWRYRRPPNRENKAEWIQQRKANLEEAKKYYLQAVEADPDTYEAFLDLAELYISDGDVENAVRTLMQRYDRGVRREGLEARKSKIYMSLLRDRLFESLAYLTERDRKVPLLDKEGKLVQDDQGKPASLTVPSLQTLHAEQAADLGDEDARVLFMKARLALLANDVSKATRHLEDAASKTNLQSPDPRERALGTTIQRYLADQYRATGQWGYARAALEKVRGQNPTDTRVLASLAETILAEGNKLDGTIEQKYIDEAMPLLELARQIDPDNDQGNLLRILSTLGRVYEAQKNFDQLKAVQAQINKLQREQGIEGATVADKLGRAMILRLQAQSPDSAENLKAEAVQLLREVLQESPFNITALRNLTSIYFEDNNSEAIKALLDEQSALTASKPDVASRPADDEMKRARFLNAIEQLRVFTDPTLTDDQKDQKIEELAAASVKQDSAAQDKAEVAVILYQSLTRRAARAEQAKDAETAGRLNQEALARLKEAWSQFQLTENRLNPAKKGVVEALFSRAVDDKQWAEAESLIKDAVTVGLDPANGGFYRGRLLFARYSAEKKPEFIEAARREFESALTTFPSYSEGHFYYAWTLYHLNRYLEAAREFDKALELDPRNAKAALGLLLVSNQRAGEDAQADAERALQICARLIPDNPTVRSNLQAHADTNDPLASIKRREEMLEADRKAGRKDLENLVRLAGLHARQGEMANKARAKELYLEALNTDPKEFKTQLDPEILRLQIAYAYATFLRERLPAEVSEGIKLLDELRQAGKAATPLVQARTQIAYAKYMGDLFRDRFPGSPPLALVDQEYLEAGKLAQQIPSVAMDAAAHFGNTAQLENMDEKTTADRLSEAEKWARAALSSAQAIKSSQDEKNARQVLVQVLITKRTVARGRDQEAQCDAEIRKELDAYRAKGYGDNWELFQESSLLVKTNRLDEALQLLQKYIGTQPKDPVPAHLVKADIHLLRNQRKEAIEELTKVKLKQPDAENGTYSARLRLARTFKNNDQIELAIAEFNSILAEARVGPGTIGVTVANLLKIYMDQKAWDRAEQLLKSRLDKEPRNAAFGELMFRLYLEKGEPDRALQYGIDAIRNSNFDFDLVNAVLEGGLRSRQYDRVYRFLTEILPPEQRNHPIYLAKLGAALAGKGDKAKALAAYNQALDIAAGYTKDLREDIEVFALLANSLTSAMGRDVGVQTMQERLAKDPKQASAGYMRALFKKDDGDKQGAIADLQQILQSLPPDDDRQLLNRLAVNKALAAIYYEMGDFPRSREQYEALLDSSKKYPMRGRVAELSVFAMNNLAYMLMDKLKDPKAALPYSSQAVALNPTDANILDTLGWNQVLVGQNEQAIATLRQAIKIMETRNAAIQYHLAEALDRKAQEQADATAKKMLLDEAASACLEAHRTIQLSKSDPEGVLDDIIRLGEKLGLKLGTVDLKTAAGQAPA